ncbi:hypothetical protein PTKIN_Ptkin02bG0031300 [Pterospermum kingtungense]
MCSVKVIVTRPEDVLSEGKDLWGTVVVAQFIGKVPNFSYFQRTVQLIWGTDGDVEIFPTGNPLYMDNITAEKKKLAYAKVCVEIEVARKIPKYITIVLGRDCKTTEWRLKQQGTSVVGSENNSGSGGSKSLQGRVGSKVKFPTLVDEAAKDVSMTNDVQQPSSVVALMDNIKAQVRDSLAKRKLEVDKRKGVLVKDVKVQDEITSVQGQFNVGHVGIDGKNAKVQDKGCSNDGKV